MSKNKNDSYVNLPILTVIEKAERIIAVLPSAQTDAESKFIEEEANKRLWYHTGFFFKKKHTRTHDEALALVNEMLNKKLEERDYDDEAYWVQLDMMYIRKAFDKRRAQLQKMIHLCRSALDAGSTSITLSLTDLNFIQTGNC